MRVFFIYISIILPGLANPLLAQRHVSLSDALKMFNENNLEIRQQQTRFQLAQQDVKDSRNALLPKLSLGINQNYNYGLTFDQIAGQLITGNRWTNSANANLNTQAVLFQGFALRNRIHDAILDLEASNQQLRTLKRSLKLQLLQYFFTAITNKALYTSSLSQLEFSQEQLEIQKQQLALGSKTLVDIALAENQVAADEFNVLNSYNSSQEALISLKQLLNIPYTDSLVLEISNELRLEASIMDTNISELLSASNNPFIAQAEIQKAKAELGIRAAKDSYLPTLSFTGGYGTNYSSERRDMLSGRFLTLGDQITQNKSLYLGLALSAPILDGFRVRSAKSRASLQLMIQTDELDKIKREQEKIYRLALQEMRRSRQEYTLSKKQFESLKTALTAMSERYDLGVATSTEYAQALLDHNLGELKVVASKYTYIYAYEILDLLQK